MNSITLVREMVGHIPSQLDIGSLRKIFKGEDINYIIRSHRYKELLKAKFLEFLAERRENYPESEITKFLDLLDTKTEDFTNWGFAFVEGTMEEISEVMGYMGIPIPDSLDFLPGASEIVLGIKLLMDIRAVNNDFEGISSDKKKNLLAAKALVTISKFGITTTLVSLGAFAGGAVGAPVAGFGALLGAPAGGIIGGISAGVLNRRIAPHAKELSYRLLNISNDDLFYYKNKQRIDNIAIKLNDSSYKVRSLEFRPGNIPQ